MAMDIYPPLPAGDKTGRITWEQHFDILDRQLKRRDWRYYELPRSMAALAAAFTLGLVLGLFVSPATAASHFYASVGVGLNDNLTNHVEWNSDGQMACQFAAGYRRNVWRGLWIDAGYRHHSQCNYSSQLYESRLDHVGINAEWRW